MKRLLVIGAGETGSTVIDNLLKTADSRYLPIGIIDDDDIKQHIVVHGVKVLGKTAGIPSIIQNHRVDEILVAIPTASKETIRNICNICKETKKPVMVMPRIDEFMYRDSANIGHARQVNIEDLLGREEADLDIESISTYLKGETILVTGGGGSIGSELCRQIAKFEPGLLLIFDIYENTCYELEYELKREYGDDLNFKVLIGSVQDKKILAEVFEEYRPGVVFHAAAHKHVPLMEDNPIEAIKNNVFGTFNVALISSEFKVKRFTLISTDKAVNPTNIMGATKRLCEQIMQSFAENSDTIFSAVRFGNVLGSNGSVIPLFQKQIDDGGPVTLTHPDITRYFMTIPEAAKLVIQAGAFARGGEIFVLDMGEPVKIKDLAEDLVRLNGLEPGKDIEIAYIGLRPGEKIYEELLMDEDDLMDTKNRYIYTSKAEAPDFEQIKHYLDKLTHSMSIKGINIKSIMKEIVPTYHDDFFMEAAASRERS